MGCEAPREGCRYPLVDFSGMECYWDHGVPMRTAHTRHPHGAYGVSFCFPPCSLRGTVAASAPVPRVSAGARGASLHGGRGQRQECLNLNIVELVLGSCNNSALCMSPLFGVCLRPRMGAPGQRGMK